MRVVDHQRGGGGEVQVRREEAAHGFAEGVRGGVEGAMAADEVIAEGELGMPSVGVANDVGVTRNDEPTCPERSNDPAAGFVAGADEVGGPGDFAPAGHLAVGDEEKDALARPGDPCRCAGPETVGVSKAVLGACGMEWKSS